MWEIFSYAQTPFTDIHAKRVPRALKSGLRLPNPGCSEQVYNLMTNTWEKCPDDRHTFKAIKVTGHCCLYFAGGRSNQRAELHVVLTNAA